MTKGRPIIEGFWSLVKRGISGVYHSVSGKDLQMYLDEYSFRYNHRNVARSLFDLVTEQAVGAASSTASP